MAGPDERSFQVFNRGVVRDDILLAYFRNALAVAINPDTGQTFTSDEIERATQPGTRFYIEADSIDLFGQAQQQRAVFFVSQIDPRRANTNYLNTEHGRIWLGPDSRLVATGADGAVAATGTDGTVIPGGATIPDPAAAVATDPNGNRYQNITTEVIGVAPNATGQASLTLKGIDTGLVTNLAAGTVLTWSANINPGTDPTASVSTQFEGGFDEETDEEYSERIVQRIRDRPASGNAAHFQAWAQQVSTAVDQAFVYPVALNAGSVLVAITKKRNPDATTPEGPDARVPTNTMLLDVGSFLIAPDSPVVPQRVFVVVTGMVPQPADMTLRISMSLGRSGGWADVIPWPSYSTTFESVEITSLTSQTVFSLSTDVALPNGAPSATAPDAPQMMVFDEATSRWIELTVTSVTRVGATNVFDVVLASAPTGHTLALGDRISPYTDQFTAIAEAVESYFDTLGPGEVVQSADPRFARAARQPAPADDFPIRAGQAVIGTIQDALGGVSADSELTEISRNEPDLPTNIVDGPFYVTFGNTNVFPL